MNAIWKLIADPNTDPVLLRVFRWLLQWPEALTTATAIDMSEMMRATGFTEEAIEGAFAQLVGRGCIRLHAGSPRDGVRWFSLALFAADAYREDAPTATAARVERLPREQRRAISNALRWTVLERDGHRCCSCGATVTDGARLVIDHVVPFSKGGLTVEGNLQALCYDCNAGKSDRMPATP